MIIVFIIGLKKWFCWGKKKNFIDLSKDIILREPVQYSFFTLLEGFKTFFWESTKIGFVTYPRWLSSIFANTLFKGALRLVLSLFSMIKVGQPVTVFVKRHLSFEEKSVVDLNLVYFCSCSFRNDMIGWKKCAKKYLTIACFCTLCTRQVGRPASQSLQPLLHICACTARCMSSPN